MYDCPLWLTYIVYNRCVMAIRTWVLVLFHYRVFDLLIARKRYSFLKTNASFVDTQLHLAYYGCLLDFLDVQYIGPSLSTERHLTQGEAEKEALAIRINQKFAPLEEERTEKEYSGAFIFPIRLEGKVNENAFVDTGSDMNTMPYRIYEQLGREDMKKEDRGITMINHTQTEAMEKLSIVLYQVGVTTGIAKFLILDIPIDRDSPMAVDYMRNAKSDSDDEEEYLIKRNTFGAPIYGPRPAPYLNCTNPEDRSSAIQTVTNPFQKISVWKKAVSFLGSLPVPLKQVNWKPEYKGSYTKEEEATGKWRTEIRTQGTHDEEAGSSRSKRPRQHETVDELLLPQVHHNYLLWEGYNREIRAFNINEPIYAKLCHEFYSTYEFDEVYADDELQTKKIIRFRLGGRTHSLTLLEFARRLGLYQTVELGEEGFNVYFEGGLRSDEHFNAQEYWLSISREENLSLSRSHASAIKHPVLRVVHKMITYGLCQRTTGDLDTTTLRELIDSEGRLIHEDPQPSVPRVGTRKEERAQDELAQRKDSEYHN
ncbi:gag protease polyprotein [Tanacetum coccineum]